MLLVQHPEEPLRTRKWAAIRPAKHASPEEDASQIRCATCHVTHGDGSPAHGAATDLNTKRAARPMMRTGVSQQCATCHGLDAPRFTLYRHDPAKRRAAGGLLKKQD